MITPYKQWLCNNRLQKFPAITYFCHNKLHLRCCTGLELNVVTWFTKICSIFVTWSTKISNSIQSNPKKKKHKEQHKNMFSEVFCIKACVRYFSLFLKEKYVSWLFRTKYFEIKFKLQLLYLPIVSRAFILSWVTTRCPPS